MRSLHHKTLDVNASPSFDQRNSSILITHVHTRRRTHTHYFHH